MNFMTLLYLFSLFPKNSVIKNSEYPLCKNCIYYRPSVLDIFSDEKFGKCIKYGTKDTVSGVIYYNYASSYRKYYSENCGIEGKDFVDRPDFITLINNTLQSLSEKSSKNNSTREKKQTTIYNDDTAHEKNGEEKEGCFLEEENCSTEFCNECFTEICKKKPTDFIDVDIVSDKFTRY